MVKTSTSRGTEKTPLKKGAWSAEEDRKLIDYIKRYKIWNWSEMSKAAGLARSGKSCRLRWVNYLRPDIKHGNFTKEEEETIMTLHETLGNRWSAIAAKLPGRTDNEVKNFWHTHLKKRVKLISSTTSAVLSTNSLASKSSQNIDEASSRNLFEPENRFLEESSKNLDGFGNIVIEPLTQQMSIDNLSSSPSPSPVITTLARKNCEIGFDDQHQNVNSESIIVDSCNTFVQPESSWTQQQQPTGNGDLTVAPQNSQVTIFDADPLMGSIASEAMWQQNSLWAYDFYGDVYNDWLDYMDPIF